MPSLFEKKSIDDLSQAITALSRDDRKKLMQQLNAAATAERKDQARKKKIAAIEASCADRNKLPAIRFCAGALKRVGLSIEAAADLTVAQLDEALAKSRASLEEKFQIKTAMRRIGLLGA